MLRRIAVVVVAVVAVVDAGPRTPPPQIYDALFEWESATSTLISALVVLGSLLFAKLHPRFRRVQ